MKSKETMSVGILLFIYYDTIEKFYGTRHLFLQDHASSPFHGKLCYENLRGLKFTINVTVNSVMRDLQIFHIAIPCTILRNRGISTSLQLLDLVTHV